MVGCGQASVGTDDGCRVEQSFARRSGRPLRWRAALKFMLDDEAWVRGNNSPKDMVVSSAVSAKTTTNKYQDRPISPRPLIQRTDPLLYQSFW